VTRWRTLAGRLEAFTQATGHLVAWLTLIMMLLMALVVVLRYGFAIGNIALQESVMYLHGALFMLGAAYTLARDEHVRVDIFYQHFSPRRKALVNLLGTLLLLIPICALILITSWDYVFNSWQRLEGSADAGGLPLLYLLKTLLLVMPVLMLVQGVTEVVRAILVLRGEAPLPRDGDEEGQGWS
jgi:TRAP-type mannitol/chloroaromatic compound transport system permease small subunit